MVIFLLVCIFTFSVQVNHARPPNILFSIVESTEASAYFAGVPQSQIPMPIPTLQSLMSNGVTFLNHYVNAPVCCPSRASIVSGRHVHKIGHYQASPSTGLYVNGAWNNHEGLPSNYSSKFMDVLSDSSNFNNNTMDSYNWKVFGKTDWDAGGHSLSCRVTAWCNKVDFPYTITTNSSTFGNEYMAGWSDESGPVFKDTNTSNPNATHYGGDWNDADHLVKWIQNLTATEPDKPWLAYFSPSICHPPYGTTSYWLDKVDSSKITTPEWLPIDEMHYEDFQSSMKKRMFGHCCRNTSTGSNQGKSIDDYKVAIRKHYFAAVAEYDSMLTKIINNLAALDLLNNTWIIATSDHGDMNMEHMQYYKMVFWEGSSHVPLIIQPPLGKSGYYRNVSVSNITSSIDFFPTFMEMAGLTPPTSTVTNPAIANNNIGDTGVDMNVLKENKDALTDFSNWYNKKLLAKSDLLTKVNHHDDVNDDVGTELELDGFTLFPFLVENYTATVNRPNYIMSQFHGDEIHLSWFMLRQDEWKYVTYGTGNEVPNRLFNIANDPNELKDYGNMTNNEYYNNIMTAMDTLLKTIIDYPNVSTDVESYNKASYVLWRNSFTNMTLFNETVKHLRWNHSWTYNSQGSFDAIDKWLKTPNDTFTWAVNYEKQEKFINMHLGRTGK